MESTAARQLEALGDVAETLDRESIWYVLFGGWAVDFYVGTVTRLHDDVDLAVWLTDHPKIAKLLQDAGWRHAPHADEDGGTGYERNGVRIEFTFLAEERGSTTLPLRKGSVPWPYDLRGERRELNDVAVPIVSLASLLAGKSFVRDEPRDVAKDRADIEALERVAAGFDDESRSRS